MVEDLVTELPAPSVAVQVMVVTPNGNELPETRPVVGEEAQTTGTGAVTASVATTVYVIIGAS